MKTGKFFAVACSLALLSPAMADDAAVDADSEIDWTAATLVAADDDRDKRKDRRDERGRADERDDRRDCRQEEGRVGKDKRECKQEDVRDGARGRKDDDEDNA